MNGENPTTLLNGVGVRIKQLVSKIKQYALTASEEGQDALTVSHYKTLYNFITLWESRKDKSLIELTKYIRMKVLNVCLLLIVNFIDVSSGCCAK